MANTPNPSPRAQAILRAIEGEAQARRRRLDSSSSTAGATALLPDATLGDSVDRLTRLVDEVVAQTENIRGRVQQIEASLDALSGVLAESHAPTQQMAAAAPVLIAEQPSGQARLTAIEMAVSGNSRGEVKTHLTRELGVSDPAPILADVFGADAADSVRMPWRE
jgi:hypothetical protein